MSHAVGEGVAAMHGEDAALLETDTLVVFLSMFPYLPFYTDLLSTNRSNANNPFPVNTSNKPTNHGAPPPAKPN